MDRRMLRRYLRVPDALTAVVAMIANYFLSAVFNTSLTSHISHSVGDRSHGITSTFDTKHTTSVL